MDETELKLLLRELFQNKTPIHLVLRNSRWFNGTIHSLTEKFLVLDEIKEGLLPLKIEHISKVSLWREK